MIEVPLTRGQVAIVDDQDADLVLGVSWFADPHRKTFYARRAFRGPNGKRRTEYLHRIILARMIGDLGSMQTDHADRDGLNNRRLNLRVATRTQNLRNRGGTIGSSSKYKGVYWSGWRGHWVAVVRVSKARKLYLGSYFNEEQAARAYDVAARQHFGDFAYTNFQ